MKRPRFALWVKWECGFDVPVLRIEWRWWQPAWLRNWAIKRVDRWHAEREKET